MASLKKQLNLIIFSILCNTYTSLASPLLGVSHKTATTYRVSSIAAEPSVLPYSPALSPDITPLFPTTPTTSTSNPPSDSSLPIIPSSPSPPNPDFLSTPHPQLSISPTGSILESSAFALNVSSLLSSSAMLLLFLTILFW